MIATSVLQIFGVVFLGVLLALTLIVCLTLIVLLVLILVLVLHACTPFRDELRGAIPHRSLHQEHLHYSGIKGKAISDAAQHVRKQDGKHNGKHDTKDKIDAPHKLQNTK